MKLQLPAIPEAERTPLVEALVAIIDAQQQRIQQLEETVQLLRDDAAAQAAFGRSNETARFGEAFQKRYAGH
jgi:hypothetical protein